MVEVDERQVKYLAHYHYTRIVNDTNLLLEYMKVKAGSSIEEAIRYILQRMGKLSKELDELKNRKKKEM